MDRHFLAAAIACSLALTGCLFEGELPASSEAGLDLASHDRRFADTPSPGETNLGDGFLPADLGDDDAPGPSQTCNNGVREGTEACDGLDLGGRSCVSEGYDLGELACQSSCTLDTSGCVECGSSSVVCGGNCCDPPSVCISDACCPASRVCGTSCCAGSQLCFDGTTCRTPSLGEIALFVTALGYSGNLGGRSGADAICANDRPAELSCSKLRAFLSMSTSDSAVAMPTIYGFSLTQPLYFYNPDQRRLSRFANSWNDAFDGTIAITVKQGTGQSSFGTWNVFWTGSKADGSYSYIPGSWDYACDGYTTAGDQTSSGGGTLGTIGDAVSTSSWLRSSSNYIQCSSAHSFLCACSLQ